MKLKRSASLLFALLVMNVSECFAQDECDKFQAALVIAEKARGLTAKGIISCKIVSHAQYEKLSSAEALNAKRLMHEEVIYKMLGLIPESYQYKKCVVDSENTITQAAYFPSKRSIYLLQDSNVPIATLIHEAIHALQDQYFDLNKLSRLRERSSDRNLAISALVEGDAVKTEVEYINAHKDHPPGSETSKPTETDECRLPPALNQIFEFPYTYGMLYVNQLRSKGGTEAVNQSFLNLPVATSQIIHFKSFFSCTNCSDLISLNIWRGQLGEEIPAPNFSDSLGEYVLKTLFEQWLVKEKAILGAKGLLFDKIYLFKDQHTSSNYLVWNMLWESEADAEKFLTYYIMVAQELFKFTVNTKANQALASDSAGHAFGYWRKNRQTSIFIKSSVH